MHQNGGRGFQGEDRDPRCPLFGRRRKTSRAVRQGVGQRRAESQSAELLQGQAGGEPPATQAIRRIDLPARAAIEGRRRRSARSAYGDVAGGGERKKSFPP